MLVTDFVTIQEIYFHSVSATGTTIVKSSIILQDSPRNVGTLELINHLVNKLINQSVFKMSVSTPATSNVVEKATSSSIMRRVNTTEAREVQTILGSWGGETIEESTDPTTESRNQEEESEEDSLSADDLQNDTSCKCKIFLMRTSEYHQGSAELFLF